MTRIPLVKPHLPRLEEIENELREILNSGRLTNFGPFSQQLEKSFCDLIGVRYALCVSNATTGLTLLLSTLPRGSEVLVPSFTFLPSVQSILWNSLVPVFVDIDIETLTSSPESLSSHITDKTSAILAVHTFGNPCAIEELELFARRRGIKLFFDGAHSFGAKYKGEYLGGFGNAEVFSLSATKLLPCGEGGVITTNSDLLCQAILNRRNYGFKSNSRDCLNMGLNGKITEFSAILGVHEITAIDDQVKKRNELAQKYIQSLRDLPGLKFQKIKSDTVSTYKDFAIVIDSVSFGLDRNILKEKLYAKGIETDSYFSPPVHAMTYFKEHNFAATDLSNTNQIETKILSLPIYSDLLETDLEYIINSIKNIHYAAKGDDAKNPSAHKCQVFATL